MIQLSNFDYDTAEVSIKADGVDMVIKVASSFTEEAIKAMLTYDASIQAAESQDIPLKEEYDNHGVKLERFTETYEKLRAQLAESLVIDWPIDEPIFETLVDSQTLTNAIIAASREKGEEFAKKKNK